MAEVVLRHKLERAGLAERVQLDSSGTGTWHEGEAMHRQAATLLTSLGYDASRHSARHFEVEWFDRYDVVLAMDRSNLADLGRLARTGEDRQRVLLFRAFDPDAGDDDDEVPDPFYGDAHDYEQVHDIVDRTSDAVVSALTAMFSGSPGRSGTG